MKSRRRSRRYPARKKVMLGETEPKFFASTLNISKNGLAIESKRVLLPNSRIVVKLYSKDWVMILEGVVKWMLLDASRAFYRIGIKFSHAFHECDRLSLH